MVQRKGKTWNLNRDEYNRRLDSGSRLPVCDSKSVALVILIKVDLKTRTRSAN